MDSTECRKIIDRYYNEIYSYCFTKLKYNKHSAEDCTQEVFVIFFQKHQKLDENNIRIWLYRTADNIIKTYLRKNTDNNIVSIEDSAEAVNIADSSQVFENDKPDIFDCLTEEELKLVRLYYDTDYGNRKETAEKNGLTLTALYQRIHKIKQKLKNYINKK